jgi:adenylate cyclase
MMLRWNCWVVPKRRSGDRALLHTWETHLIGRPVWQVIPLEKIQYRLEDSLETGAKQYVPEQTLKINMLHPDQLTGARQRDGLNCELLVADAETPANFGSGAKPIRLPSPTREQRN